MSGVVLVPPKFQFLDAVGNPLSGGSVDVYLAGTTTRTSTWQDQAQTSLNTNPIVLDANGSCTMVVDSALSYKLVVKDSGGSVQSHLGGDNIVASAVGSATNLTFLQSGTGAVTRTSQNKMRDIASFDDFGAAGDGTTDDITALTNALASGKKIVSQRGKTYKITSTLTITDKDVDFSGCTILYTGAKNAFAMVINANSGTFTSCIVRNFVLKSTDTDTTNRTHGLCLGGSLGSVQGFRVEGFTGVSLGLGSGVESYTGVTFAGAAQCFYWDVANFDIASTAGWNLVVKTSNNANKFRNISTFPFNGFGGAPTRPANCIDELVIGGMDNTFERTSLEGNPSNRKVLFLGTANGNEFLGKLYLEYNPSWATPPFPRIEALVQSSSNRLRCRHPYNGHTAISDLGTANDLRSDPTFYINGSQMNLPAGGVSMVKNGRFENGQTGWSDFSSGTAMTFGTGYLSGKSMRLDVVAGRPNVSQDVVAVGGYQVAALIGQNVTVGAWVRTNFTDAVLRVCSLTQNAVLSDGNWYWVTATIKVPAASTTVPVQLITASSNVTGFVEWSDVTAVVGNEPAVVAPRDPLDGSATFNPASLAAGATQQTTVTVTGAVVGDFVTAVSHSDAATAGRTDIVWSGQVTAADSVTVTQWNRGAGAVDLASGTLRVRVQKV